MDPSSAYSLQTDALFQGRYRVVRRISMGGMGAIYEVFDDKTRSRRALKVMLPNVIEDPDLRARFALEAQITGDIESDHIVRVSDAGIDEATATPFLVMDLLRGEDIKGLLKKRTRLPPDEVILYLMQAARALDKTHAANIVHRDLKPDNLFVTQRDDGSPCVKILDFGIAKVLSTDNKDRTTQPIGTPIYMAPEQIRGRGGIGPGTDIYALGHIAYTMLAGEPYWNDEKLANGTMFELFSRVLLGPEEPPTQRAWRRAGVRLPPGFDAWFLKAIALAPEARFDRATGAVQALAEVFGARAPQPSLPPSVPIASSTPYPVTAASHPLVDRTPPGAALEAREQRMPARQLPAPVTSPSAQATPPWAPRAQALTIAASATRPGFWTGRETRLVVLLASLVLVLVVAGLVRRASLSRARDASPVRIEETASRKALASARAKLSANDHAAAHQALRDIPESSAVHEDPAFQEIEAAWADWMFQRVDKQTDTADKRKLLKEINATPSVNAERRMKAAELLMALQARDPLPSPPSTPDPSGSPSVVVPFSRAEEEAHRKILEAKMVSGKASLDELKMLRALCFHLQNRECRDRATAMVKKRQQQSPAPAPPPTATFKKLFTTPDETN